MNKTKMLNNSEKQNNEAGKNSVNSLRCALIAVNARYSHTNLAVRLLRQTCQAKRQELAILLAEYTINDKPLSILQKLNELECNVYAFSCYVWNREIVTQLCRDLKQIRPDCIIITGGPEVSWQPRLFLEQNEAVDLVVAGAGENVIPEFLNDLITGMKLQEAGARYKNIVSRNKTAIDSGMAGIKAINVHDWPFAYTQRELRDLSDRILYYESSRGCPFGCTYCLSALEKQVIFRPQELVWQELEQFIAADVKLVKFVDRTFNCNAARARQIWQWLLNRFNQKKFRTRFHFEITAELLEDECIEILNKVPAGLFQFEIGVQSTQPEVLATINRPNRTGILIERVSQLKSAGNIHIHLDLIAGLPGETLNMFRSSFDTVAGMKPDMLQLGFLKVLPGSLMQAQADEREMAWQTRPPYEILRSDAMSFDELSILKRIENIVDLYYNSGQFNFCLNWLLSEESSKFDFFREIAELYKIQGWEDRQIGRKDQWKFLLEFCRTKRAHKDQDRIRDLLVLDFINSGQKDRPDWQQSLECSEEEADLAQVSAAKRIIKMRFPGSRRFRIERFTLKPSLIYKNCDHNLLRCSDSDTVANQTAKYNKNDWLAIFDLSSKTPLLVWQQELNGNLY